MKLESTGGKYIKIDVKTPKGDAVKVLKAAASVAKKPCPALLIVELPDGKKELWSGGQHNKGVLGQGEGVTKSDCFKRCKYDEAIEFVDVSCYSDHACAITSNGQLYGWGVNV